MGTVLLAFDSTGTLRLSLLCAVLHEAAHVAVYRCYLRRWPILELSPGGICLRMKGVFLPNGKELVLAAAGPLCNLILCSVTILHMRFWGQYSYGGYWFASINLLVGTANLLPVPGLDGYRILCCLCRELHFFFK